MWYVPNFLADDARDAVAAACVKLRSKLRVDHSVAVGRLSAAAPVTSAAYAAFASAPALSKLRQLTSCESLALGDYPVEVRLYRVGSSMGWHTDVRLYDPPQYELIYTATNSSDAKTEWVGSDGARRAITPPANSLLLFRAEGARHRVVSGSEGERTIVKALFVERAGCAKTEAFGEVMEQAPWRR